MSIKWFTVFTEHHLKHLISSILLLFPVFFISLLFKWWLLEYLLLCKYGRRTVLNLLVVVLVKLWRRSVTWVSHRLSICLGSASATVIIFTEFIKKPCFFFFFLILNLCWNLRTWRNGYQFLLTSRWGLAHSAVWVRSGVRFNLVTAVLLKIALLHKKI